MLGSPGLQAMVAQLFPATLGLRLHPRVSGAEQEHRHFPFSLSRGMFYPLGWLVYGYRQPLNESLIHSRMPHDSKGRHINENTNSEQKVVINVQCTCAASLIMLPGNRGRGGRASPGGSESFSSLGFCPGERESPTDSSLLLIDLHLQMYMHAYMHTYISFGAAKCHPE